MPHLKLQKSHKGDYPLAHPMPSCGVCLSVRLSRSYVLYKQIYLSSKFFTVG